MFEGKFSRLPEEDVKDVLFDGIAYLRIGDPDDLEFGEYHYPILSYYEAWLNKAGQTIRILDYRQDTSAAVWASHEEAYWDPDIYKELFEIYPNCVKVSLLAEIIDEASVVIEIWDMDDDDYPEEREDEVVDELLTWVSWVVMLGVERNEEEIALGWGRLNHGRD